MIKNYTLVLFLTILSIRVFALPGGTYTVGAGGDYTTLDSAIDAVNGGITGSVTLLLTDDNYTITSQLIIQASANINPTNTLTIKPNTDKALVTITGSLTSSVFKIDDASYVTIDGSSNGTSGKNLLITNTSTNTSSAVIWLAGSATGATHNSIKNCIITGNSKTTTFACIFSGGSTIGIASNATAENADNTFQNNTISKAQNGIYVLGMSASSLDHNLNISNNNLGSNGGGNGFILSGVTIKYQTNANISNNDIQNLVYAATLNVKLTDGAGNKIYVGLYVFNSTNTTIAFNKIHKIDISTSGTVVKYCYSLSLESPAFNSKTLPANNVVYNNMIYDGRFSGATAFANWAYSGINENGGYNDQFYFNSVLLDGDFSTSATATNYAAFSNGNGANSLASPVLKVENNIFDIDAVTGNPGNNFYCHYSTLTIIGKANVWNYNDFNAPFAANGYVGYYANNNQQQLADWQLATNKDQKSKSIAPVFRSATDLHLTNCSGENDALNASGSVVPGVQILTDIDGDIRAASPDIGADEFTLTEIFWTGTTSTDWNDPTNWSCGSVPGPTSDVFIPVTVKLPHLSTPVVVNSAHIDAGASINLHNKALTIRKTFSGTGVLIGSALSKLIIKGDAGTVYFSNTSPENTLLVLNVPHTGSLTLGSSLYIDGGTAANEGKVTVDGTLNSNGFLTLGSNANATAVIASSDGTINGNVTVERFIPGRRAWRFLTVPFSSTTQSINDAWQEGQTFTTLDCSATQSITVPGYGTEITNENIPGTGYDQNPTSNPSIKVYLNNAFSDPINNTKQTNILAYPAYCLFVRGDRTICLSAGTGAAPTNTILRAKGILNQTGGLNIVSQAYNVAAAGNYILIGNPYASSIDLTHIIDGSRSSTNNGFVTNQVSVWDPVLPGSSGAGAYVTWTSNGLGTGGIWAPTDDGSGNPGSYPAGSTNLPIIESGQAFMLQTNATTANIQFQESDKTVNEISVFGRSMSKGNSAMPVIYTNLVAGDNKSVVDGVAAGFANRFSSAVDANDAQKRWNDGSNISLHRAGKDLAIELRPYPDQPDTLFLKLNVKPQQYALKIFTKDASGNLPASAWLIDKYLNTRTPVKFDNATVYAFIATADTGSYKDRFMLILIPDNYSSTEIGQAVAKTENPCNMSLYPNPVRNNYFMLTATGLQTGMYKATMYDASGSPVMIKDLYCTGSVVNYKIRINKNLIGGIYTISLRNENKQLVNSKKLFINR